MPSVNTIVFKSARKNDFYLYIKADSEFESLPMELRHSFGTPIFVMDLTIDEQRSLARADTLKVLRALEENGFYLQLPSVIYEGRKE
tara:strand:- start:119 stop:379 length:261 start_codon:yes stop_codon:yes gene_type:complete